MVRILRETDKSSVADVAKKHGISGETLYKWKRKFGRMDVDDAKRLKMLESENAKLKKMLADRIVPSLRLPHDSAAAREAWHRDER
jgi:putative transposase